MASTLQGAIDQAFGTDTTSTWRPQKVVARKGLAKEGASKQRDLIECRHERSQDFAG